MRYVYAIKFSLPMRFVHFFSEISILIILPDSSTGIRSPGHDGREQGVDWSVPRPGGMQEKPIRHTTEKSRVSRVELVFESTSHLGLFCFTVA